MTSETNMNDYDENSVFNRLFREENRGPKAPTSNRVAQEMTDVKTPEDLIRVQDFLPTY